MPGSHIYFSSALYYTLEHAYTLSTHWLGNYRKDTELTYNMECAAHRLGCCASSISSTATVLSSVPLFHCGHGGCDCVLVSTITARVAADATIIWCSDKHIRLLGTADNAGDDNVLTNPHHWIRQIYHHDNWRIH